MALNGFPSSHSRQRQERISAPLAGFWTGLRSLPWAVVRLEHHFQPEEPDPVRPGIASAAFGMTGKPLPR